MAFTEHSELYKTISGQIDYFLQHGISEGTLTLVDTPAAPGFCKDWENPERMGKPSEKVIFPITKYAYRACEPEPHKAQYPGQNIGKDDSFICFGDLLNMDKSCYFITRYEIDALSLIEIGYPAIAYGNTTDCIDRLENFFNNRRKAGKEDTDKIFIVLPCDNPKDRERAGQIWDHFSGKLQICIGNIFLEDRYTNTINEMLINDREHFRKLVSDTVREAEEKYLPNEERYLRLSALEKSKDLFKRITSPDSAPVATGFERLNEVLGGGLFPGLYVLGAISSLGKTTFILQLAESIAAAGGSVLFFSLEMATDELIAKSYSRLSYELAENKRNAKTTRGILNPLQVLKYNTEEKKLLFETVPAAFAKYAERLYINEGLGSIGVSEIREEVQKHISVTGHKPTVFIDYLQILRPEDPHMTDKQAVDKNILELKKLSRDLSVPIFAISSFNRENYYAPLSMTAFKESGAIEYSTDVLLGLQPAGIGREEKGKKPADTLEDCKTSEIRDIELKILKNRNGQTNAVIPYTYYAKFNRFQESPEDTTDWE